LGEGSFDQKKRSLPRLEEIGYAVARRRKAKGRREAWVCRERGSRQHGGDRARSGLAHSRGKDDAGKDRESKQDRGASEDHGVIGPPARHAFAVVGHSHITNPAGYRRPASDGVGRWD
jgi:hypothetical protein